MEIEKAIQETEVNRTPPPSKKEWPETFIEKDDLLIC